MLFYLQHGMLNNFHLREEGPIYFDIMKKKNRQWRAARNFCLKVSQHFWTRERIDEWTRVAIEVFSYLSKLLRGHE